MNRKMMVTVTESVTKGITNGMILPVGSVAEKKSGAISLSHNEIELNFIGTYIVHATFMMKPEEECSITIKAYNNGKEIPGASASTETDCLVSIPIYFVIEKESKADRPMISFAVFSHSVLQQINATVSVVMV